jgi:DNA-binding LacI/PurR family transcriptional regulator
MGSRPTIRDVAERAGVSNATVSNVINEKGKVSESTRRDVLEAIEALNYRPNASAQRRLQSNGPKGIGLLRALRELGIDVPVEVSVAGLDNIKAVVHPTGPEWA